MPESAAKAVYNRNKRRVKSDGYLKDAKLAPKIAESMGENKQINVRLPQEILADVARVAEFYNVTKTELHKYALVWTMDMLGANVELLLDNQDLEMLLKELEGQIEDVHCELDKLALKIGVIKSIL